MVQYQVKFQRLTETYSSPYDSYEEQGNKKKNNNYYYYYKKALAGVHFNLIGTALLQYT
jgi:hypothetical protein